MKIQIISPKFTKLLLFWFGREELLLYREQLFLRLTRRIAIKKNFIKLQETVSPLEFLQQKHRQFFKTWTSVNVMEYKEKSASNLINILKITKAKFLPTMQNVAAKASTQDNLQGFP